MYDKVLEIILETVNLNKKSIYFSQDLVNVMALKCKIELPKHLKKYINDPKKYKDNPELDAIKSKEYIEKIIPYYIKKCISVEYDNFKRKFHPSPEESCKIKKAIEVVFNSALQFNTDGLEKVYEASNFLKHYICNNRFQKYVSKDLYQEFLKSDLKKEGYEGIKKFIEEHSVDSKILKKIENNLIKFQEVVSIDSFDKKVSKLIIQELHKDLADDFRTITLTPEYKCQGDEVYFRGIVLPSDTSIVDWLSENHIAKGGMSFSSWLDYFVNNQHVGVLGVQDDRAGYMENGATSTTPNVFTALNFATCFNITNDKTSSYLLEIRPKAGTALTTAIATGQMGVKVTECEIFFDQIYNRDIKVYKISNEKYDDSFEVERGFYAEKIKNPYYIKRDNDIQEGMLDLIEKGPTEAMERIFKPYEGIDPYDFSFSINEELTKEISLVSYEDVIFNRLAKGEELVQESVGYFQSMYDYFWQTC